MGLRRLHQRGFAGHFHLLTGPSDYQLHIDRPRSIRHQSQALPCRSDETWVFYLQIVSAGR